LTSIVSHTLLFFFLLIRPPPISTLFPYTTLFRSRSCIHCRSRALLVRHITSYPRTTAAIRSFPDRCSLSATGRAADTATEPGCEDRKSTRLNSSHVSISYAVFCLKKKNTIQQERS